MGEGVGHVFTLVQLLGGDDAVLFTLQVASKTFHRDVTWTYTTQQSLPASISSLFWFCFFVFLMIATKSTSQILSVVPDPEWLFRDRLKA